MYYILNYLERRETYEAYNYVFDNLAKLMKAKEEFVEDFKKNRKKDCVCEAESDSCYTATDEKGLVCKLTITMQDELNQRSSMVLNSDDIYMLLDQEEKYNKSSVTGLKKTGARLWPTGG